MAGWFTVKQGQSLASIAAMYRLTDWNTIYNRPENADFRQLRPNPHVIYPGDQVYIPDPELRIESKPTDNRHVFIKHVKIPILRIQVKDGKGRPFANCAYKLEVGGKSSDGTTTAEGAVEEPVAPQAGSGRLTLWLEGIQTGACFRWDLQIAFLDPIEEISGVQARLNNLAYNAGAVDGIAGPRTRAAVSAFQEDSNITVDGIVGPQTRGELKTAYGM